MLTPGAEPICIKPNSRHGVRSTPLPLPCPLTLQGNNLEGTDNVAWLCQALVSLQDSDLCAPPPPSAPLLPPQPPAPPSPYPPGPADTGAPGYVSMLCAVGVCQHFFTVMSEMMRWWRIVTEILIIYSLRFLSYIV